MSTNATVLEVAKHGIAMHGNDTIEERDVFVILTNRGLFLLDPIELSPDNNVLISCVMKFIPLDRHSTLITTERSMLRMNDEEANYVKFKEKKYTWMSRVYQVLDGTYDKLDIHSKDTSLTTDVVLIEDDKGMEMVSRDIANQIINRTPTDVPIRSIEKDKAYLQEEKQQDNVYDFIDIPTEQEYRNQDRDDEEFEKALEEIRIMTDEELEETDLAEAIQMSIQESYAQILAKQQATKPQENKTQEESDNWEIELEEEDDDDVESEASTPTTEKVDWEDELYGKKKKVITPLKGDDVIIFIGANDERIVLGEGTFS
jgi:hypothetical protein